MIEIKKAILKMILRKNMISVSEYTKALRIYDKKEVEDMNRAVFYARTSTEEERMYKEKPWIYLINIKANLMKNF